MIPTGRTTLFNNRQELYDALLKTEPKTFVSSHIIEPVPFAFGGDFLGWLRWKQVLADSLDVDPYNVVMTGSAAIGFSLNPQKGLKQFHDGSDFDCGVISDYYFDVAWRYLRQSQVSWLSYPRKLQVALRSHKDQYIFEGTVATDRILGVLPFGKEWLSAIEKMSALKPFENRAVKMRIYKDFDALRHYQAKNIEQLRGQLAGESLRGSGSEDIITEDNV